MPFAFTEHGVIMLASLLRSDIAIHTSIKITRAFVAMRNYIMSTQHLESELTALKTKLELLERNDSLELLFVEFCRIFMIEACKAEVITFTGLKHSFV